jgi:ribonucleoside-diphosphate reductase beta chain
MDRIWFVCRAINCFCSCWRIFFSGAFCSIYWLKKTWINARIDIFNELISRDEGVHCDFAVHLHNHHLINKVPKKELEVLLMLWILKRIYYRIFQWSLIGMNAVWWQYLEFVADRLLVELGLQQRIQYYKSIWFYGYDFASRENKFLWKKVAEYQNQGLWILMECSKISFDADF